MCRPSSSTASTTPSSTPAADGGPPSWFPVPDSCWSRTWVTTDLAHCGRAWSTRSPTTPPSDDSPTSARPTTSSYLAPSSGEPHDHDRRRTPPAYGLDRGHLPRDRRPRRDGPRLPPVRPGHRGGRHRSGPVRPRDWLDDIARALSAVHRPTPTLGRGPRGVHGRKRPLAAHLRVDPYGAELDLATRPALARGV